MGYRKKLILFIILPVVLMSLPSCTSDKTSGYTDNSATTSDQETAANTDEYIHDYTGPLEPPDKGNPKLDTGLNRLIAAESKGEAEELAERICIELIDGSVTVIIECEAGRAEAVAEAAAQVGAEQVRVRSQDNLVKAVVPITSLTTLADVPGVHRVRLPWHPVEND